MKVCPICNSANIKQNFLQFKYGYKEYSISQCLECTCKFYENDFFFDFKENFEHNRNLRTYLEKTSDLEGLITILYNFLSNFPDRTASGIDIGCGVGIIMDFAETVMGKRMIGFEPSSHYSREGKENLKLKIIEDFFKLESLGTDKVDFAVCFQVLQMIQDPVPFLQEIKKALSTQGILIFSTPDNETLNEKSVFSDHMSKLSPGVHRFILNEKSLRTLLSKAGFDHISIYKRDDQLFGLASSEPLKEVNLFDNKREAVLNYYSTKLPALPEGTPYFKGIWYRLYRNRIDHGEYKEALELLKDADWFEIWTENEIDSIQTIDRLFELNSSADAIIYYYTGILFLNFIGKYEYAERFFLLSYLLSKKFIQLQPDMGVLEKDIVWLAKLHNAIAILYKGDVNTAEIELMSFLAEKDRASADHLDSPSNDLLNKARKLLNQIANPITT